ncbi:MAG: hypothetical protein WA581_11150 [Candidatus Acidiferrales bacterium]
MKLRVEQRISKTLKDPWIAIALVIGLIQAWANRFYMAYDGVSYLDMGDAYLRGDWHAAINGYWNPLYAWVLGIGLSVLRPSAYWEYPAVQLINFVIYAATVAAFEYFLRGLLRKREDASAIRLIAYALFLWTSLELIRVWMVNPDMLVAAAVYTAFGVLVRAPAKWTPIALAAALAAGYYAKAVMFPIGLMVLLIGWGLLPRRQALVATVAFTLMSAPLIMALSRSTGHLTFGDTGRLNYSWYVNGVQSRFWQGGPVKAGEPEHPPRVVIDSPRVYEFGGIFSVTYPVWYDPSYWSRGLHVWLDPRRLIHTMLRNAKGVAKLLVYQGGGFLLGWVLCFFLQQRRSVPTRLAPPLLAWVVSLAAIILYCTVHVEPRHLGAFAAVLFLVPFTEIHIPSKRLAAIVAGFGLVWAACFYSVTTTQGERFRPWDSTPENVSWQVANGLQHLGLTAGDSVASVCDGMHNSRWARLARVHIVAEVGWSSNFWRLGDADQQRALTALATSGAKMAISDEPPPASQDAVGWQRIGSTNFYAYLF